MTKRYYIDENGFIIGEVPHKIVETETRTRSSARQTRNIKPRLDLVPCEFCDARLKPSRVKSHLERVHPSNNAIPEQGEASATHNSSDEKNKISTSIISTKKVKSIQPQHIQMIKCEICKSVMPVLEFTTHINDHFGLFSKNRPETTCPICHIKVNERNLKKHINKVHHGAWPENNKAKPVTPVPNKQQSSNHREKREKEYSVSAPPITKNQESITLESFYQDVDEKRDGSKGLGHMRHEWDGKFGSFPLHDNYDDESGSK